MNKQFNKTYIEQLPIPATGRSFYYDSKVTQLGLTVTKSGSKTFHVRATVDGRTKRIGIPRGKFPAMTAQQARNAAKLILADITKGIDPVAARRDKRMEKDKQAAKDITLRVALTNYLAKGDYKPNTIKGYWTDMQNSFGEYMDRPVSDITEDVVKTVNRERRKKSSGAIRAMKALFNWLKAEYKSQGLFQGDNPTNIINELREVHSYGTATGIIRKEDMAAWFDAVDKLDTVNREYFLFLIMTGTRADTEAAALTWDPIDWRRQTFTLIDTKNRTDIELPLPAYMIPMLKQRKQESGLVFPISGQARSLRHQVERESGVKFTRHDLRRTFLSVGASVNVAYVHIKRLANHKDDKNDITLRYIQSEMDDLRAASKAVVTFILTHAKRLNAEVISLDKFTG